METKRLFAGVHNNMGVDSHDSSVAFVIDGKLSLVRELERTSRIKHDGGEVTPLFLECLQEVGYDVDKFDYVWPSGTVLKNLKTLFGIDSRMGYNRAWSKPHSKYEDNCHHIAHALEAYYCSGYDEAAVFVNDGYGINGPNPDDLDSISLYYFKGDDYKLLATFPVDASLGILYCDACYHSGLGGEFNEGKLMGLAPYGKDTGVRLLKWDDNLKTIVKTGKQFEDIWPYVENLTSKVHITSYANFAATIQENFSEVLMDVLKYLRTLVPVSCRNLCMSGGCFQNCTSNQLICESGLFDSYYCGPIPHDGGISIGEAFKLARQIEDFSKIKHERLTHSYFGKEYSDAEIIAEVSKNSKLSYKEVDIDEISHILHEGRILGWFDGGCEIGPRALCHRSIIARPDSKEIADHINLYVKHRETWRPFAPVIMDKKFDDIFNIKNHNLFEFMLRTVRINDEYVQKLQGVCHVDQTTRPQRLVKETNPKMYSLLECANNKYGHAGLINTSFNDKGQPIVETPKDALDMFVHTPEMHGVVFNGHILVTLSN